jgi:hypothetical protein
VACAGSGDIGAAPEAKFFQARQPALTRQLTSVLGFDFDLRSALLMASRGYFSSLTKEQEDNALLNKLAVPEGSFNRLSMLLSRLVQSTAPEELYTCLPQVFAH